MSFRRDESAEQSESGDEHGVESRSRFQTGRLGAFGLVVLVTFAFTVFALGDLLMLLVVGWTAPVAAELGMHQLHVMAIAAAVTALLLGVFVQAYRPTDRVAPMLGAFLGILVVTGLTILAGAPVTDVAPFLVLVGLATLLHPAGRGLLRRGASWSPALLALVVVAAVPLVAFAANQMWLQLNAPTDPHAEAGHFLMMAALGLVPVVYGGLAAFGFSGWRVAAWLAALPVAYYGVMSALLTSQAGSAGTTWGIAAILWAVAFVVVAEYARRSTAPVIRREFARSG